jgi:membrane-associated phospholipid phosphatase
MLERLAALDIAAFKAIHHALWGTPWLPVLQVVQRAGEGWGVAALAVFVLSMPTRGARALLALRLVAPVGAASILQELLKKLVFVERPRMLVPELVLNADQHLEKHYSWPSGHTAGVFAFATAVLLVRLSQDVPSRSWTIAAGVAFVVAALTGVARVAVAAHFPGDVAGGAILGASVAVLTTLAMDEASRRLLARRALSEGVAPLVP